MSRRVSIEHDRSNGHLVPISASVLRVDSTFRHRRRPWRARVRDIASWTLGLGAAAIGTLVVFGLLFGFIWVLLAIGRALQQGGR